ncbi:hypothetical protein HYPSUDRAFT_334578 [Hypholoma sublateritium FD-334 SS-4]|uniref:Terpene synthase n=1 Tax=Hypholoma sublateritium (strain FD-334 SS-4) TaxID=945553 RepID=A0A0D2KML3_HYPSF|nr:hypothetical protein HYPSUDRAFT_334578 [Hypholoma sublateritium FD-334 SS-4]
MAPSASFQLPDLPSLIAPLAQPLRTNTHCRAASASSAAWLASLAALEPAEHAALKAARVGMRTALCSPALDAPQLRVLMDTAALVFVGARRAAAGDGEADWEDGHRGGMDMLRGNRLLKLAVTPNLERLAARAPPAWHARFTLSIARYLCAQKEVEAAAAREPPDVDAYVEARRELDGAGLMLDLGELLEAFEVPNLPPPGVALLEDLQRAALDIVAWATDIAAYQRTRGTRAAPANLVALLMRSKGLAVQGAMNMCGGMVRARVDDFRSAVERLHTLLSPPTPVPARPALSWVWGSSAKGSSCEASEGVGVGGKDGEKVRAEAERYVRALEDCIAGGVQWLYETPLFFGAQGAEIRAFGWVFADEPTPAAPGDA